MPLLAQVVAQFAYDRDSTQFKQLNKVIVVLLFLFVAEVRPPCRQPGPLPGFAGLHTAPSRPPTAAHPQMAAKLIGKGFRMFWADVFNKIDVFVIPAGVAAYLVQITTKNANTNILELLQFIRYACAGGACLRPAGAASTHTHTLSLTPRRPPTLLAQYGPSGSDTSRRARLHHHGQDVPVDYSAVCAVPDGHVRRVLPVFDSR